MDESMQVRLLECVDSYGIHLEEEQAEKLVRHLDLVIDTNKQVNLTRITSPDDAVVLHLLDSLLVLKVMQRDFSWDDSSVSFLDMGTGAGFPGVPIAICTSWRGLLVDSVRKKTDAVARFLETLSIENVSSAHGRLEDLVSGYRSCFDIVVARAVAAAPVLVEYAAPFLKKEGCLYVMKANPSEEELKGGEKAASVCGLMQISAHSFDLPDSMGHREILVYEKVRSSRIRLPRAVGKARKEPLG